MEPNTSGKHRVTTKKLLKLTGESQERANGLSGSCECEREVRKRVAAATNWWLEAWREDMVEISDASAEKRWMVVGIGG